MTRGAAEASGSNGVLAVAAAARSRSPGGGSGRPVEPARCAAPNASKNRASAGMTNVTCGQASRRNRTKCLLSVTPPTSTTSPVRTLARIRNSPTLSAITFESESAMSPLVASPLLRRCVQSDFMKTEQRAESLRACAPAVTASRSSRSRSIRPSCWRKNSPVPDAHLLPA